MQFPHQLFNTAGLNSSDVAGLVGVSRVTGWRWMSGMSRYGEPGVGVNVFLEGRVQTLADQVQAAVDSGIMPDPALAGMAPDDRVSYIRQALDKLTPVTK